MEPQEKTADAVLRKAGAGASAGFIHHSADRLGVTTGEISAAAVTEPAIRIPCLKAGVNSLMTSIIHNK